MVFIGWKKTFSIHLEKRASIMLATFPAGNQPRDRQGFYTTEDLLLSFGNLIQ